MPKPFYKKPEEQMVIRPEEETDLMFTREQLSLFGFLDIPEVKAVFSPSEYKFKRIKLPKKKKIKKQVDHSWDFRKANTKILTHGFHNYPAMMNTKFCFFLTLRR